MTCPPIRAMSARVRAVTVSRRQAAALSGWRSTSSSRVLNTPEMRLLASRTRPASAASAARLVSARDILGRSPASSCSATRRDSRHASAAERRSPYRAAASPRWLAASLSRCRSCQTARDMSEIPGSAGSSGSAASSCHSETVCRACLMHRSCRVPASSRTRTTTALAFASARGSVLRRATVASAISLLSRSRGKVPATRARSRSNHSAASPRATRSTRSRSARQVRNAMSDRRDGAVRGVRLGQVGDRLLQPAAPGAGNR